MLKNFINNKLSLKELLSCMVISILLVIPRYNWYLKLTIFEKILFLFWWIVCLSIICLIIYNLLKNLFVWQSNSINNIQNNVPNSYKKILLWNNFETIQRLRELKPRCFEYFIETLFRIWWYEIIKWPNYLWDKAQADWWKDIIVQKDWELEYIQIKKKFKYMVWCKDVEAFKWVIWTKKWIFITTSIFSEDAKIFWEKNNILCIDYDCLLKKIWSLWNDETKKLENIINNNCNIDYEFKYKPKTCKKCWAPMIWKWWRYCCLNYYPKNCTSREYL